MRRKISPLRKNLYQRMEEGKFLKTKLNVRRIMNEVCQNYDDLSETGQLAIVKEILLLLMELVFGDDPVKIVMSQGYPTEDNE